MISKFKAYLPFDSEANSEDSITNKLIHELLSISQLVSIPIDEFGEAFIKIERVDSIKLFQTKYQHFRTWGADEILQFEAEINFDPTLSSNAKIPTIYMSRFLNFLHFTQLAIPGSLVVYNVLFEIDNNYHSERDLRFSSLSTLRYEDNKHWPHITYIPIINVWNFIKNRTSILTKASKTNIENGLNAFTYLFDHPYNHMHNLYWAMSGIEALYAEGDIGIGYQIDKKAKVLLGEPFENKNKLKKLYSFRSKFIHGSMNIPINGFALLDDAYQDEYDSEFNDMSYLSSRLLAATLQLIIQKDLTSFQFEFKLIQT